MSIDVIWRTFGVLFGFICPPLACGKVHRALIVPYWALRKRALYFDGFDQVSHGLRQLHVSMSYAKDMSSSEYLNILHLSYPTQNPDKYCTSFK